MRILIAVLLLISFFVSSTTAQKSEPIYTKVEIDLSSKSLRELGRAGIDVTHGLYIKNASFTATLADYELEEIKKHGFSYSVKIPDMQQFYADRNAGDIQARDIDCPLLDLNFKSPLNFELGTMGGFFTYSQMLDHLDAMAFAYPHLITQKKAISSISTHQGNDIVYLKISDNPNSDEAEPEVLYTALHHAREPISMSQLIYFMWYLLENYDTDEEIRDIVNETELFFVPCVNPDGYIKNNETHPDGGGMWRKNLRDNDLDGEHDIAHDGVDLNRNYGFKWGFDNDGSSGSFGAEIYRGTAPFSEPETQAMREFISNRSFDFAYNYHSYGDVILYPWGYDEEVSNDREEIYLNFSDLLTRENKYEAGTSFTALEYVTNGDANDWMYGDNTKPAILTFTPEVGSGADDFYPARERIEELCMSTLAMNIKMASLPHSFGLISNTTNNTLETLNNDLNFSLKNFGTTNANFTVTIEPVTEYIDWYTTGSKSASLNSLDQVDLAFSYALRSDIPMGSRIGFVVRTDNEKITQLDTIYKIYGPESLIVYDEGNTLNNWSRPGGSEWASTSEDAFQGLTSYTDSPFGNYAQESETEIRLKQEIDLKNATDANVEFWAKWFIDDFFDYAVFQISVNGGGWTNLCGRHTTNGSIFQDSNEPIYDDIQEEWVHEQISLKDYLGQKVRFRFLMISDQFLEFDGFYFDNFSVSVLNDETTSFEPIEKDGFIFESIRPNPTSQVAYIPLTISPNQTSKSSIIIVTDLLGRKLIEQPLELSNKNQVIEVDVHSLRAGTYFCSLLSDNQIVATQTLVVE